MDRIDRRRPRKVLVGFVGEGTFDLIGDRGFEWYGCKVTDPKKGWLTFAEEKRTEFADKLVAVQNAWDHSRTVVGESGMAAREGKVVPGAAAEVAGQEFLAAVERLRGLADTEARRRKLVEADRLAGIIRMEEEARQSNPARKNERN